MPLVTAYSTRFPGSSLASWDGGWWAKRGTITETFRGGSSYNTLVAATSPAMQLKLEETSGTTATDSSGNARNATYSNVTLGARPIVNDVAGYSADFNGSTSRIDYTGSTAWLNSQTQLTVIAWVQFDSVSGIRIIAERDDQGLGGAGRHFQLRLNAGKIDWIVFPGPAGVTSTSTLTAGTTYMVVATYDGTNVKIYLNGVQDASAASTAGSVSLAQPLYFGASGNAGYNLDGRLDEVSIITTALSGATITSLFNAGYGPTVTGLDSGEGYYVNLSDIGVDPALDFEIEMALNTTTVSNGTMIGPCIHDSSGNGVLGAFYGGSPTGPLLLGMGTYTYNSAFSQAGSSNAFPSRHRITKLGGSTTYTYAVSYDDGLTWTATTTLTSSITPTRVGFASILGSAGTLSANEYIVREFGYNTITTAPTGLIVTPGNTQLTASWTAHADAVTYDVRLNGGTPVTGLTSTNYLFTGLTNGTSYTVEVRAVNPNGAGPWSSTVSGTPVSGATTLLTDDFNRANSTTSPGSPTAGGPYTVQVGTWGINGNALYTSVSTASSQITFPGAIDVDLQVTLSVLGGNQGLMPRWISTTSWIAGGTTGGVYGFYRGVGSQTGTDLHLTSKTPVAGDVLRVIAFGRYIWMLVNGKVICTLEDQWYASATTTCGIRTNSSTGARYDDLLVRTAIAAPSPDGGTAALSTLLLPGSALPTNYLYRGRLTKADDIAGVS